MGIEKHGYRNGKIVEAIKIKNDFKDELDPSIVEKSDEEIAKLRAAAGLVDPEPAKPLDTTIAKEPAVEEAAAPMRPAGRPGSEAAPTRPAAKPAV